MGVGGDGDCAESCDEAADACSGADPDNSACDDGVFCNGADTCSAGGCSVSAGDPCSGGPQCADTCDEAADICAVVDGTPCDDGLFCTTVDACDTGACAGSGNPCGGGAAYTDTCNETEDVCRGCGQPITNLGCIPNAAYARHSAVGLQFCEPCICDVDGNGLVSVTDALRLLRVCAALDPEPDACPAVAFTIGSTTTTTGSLPERLSSTTTLGQD